MTAQICDTCKWKDGKCYCAPNSTCEGYEKRTMTNFEKIKLMDIDEMAELMSIDLCELCHFANPNDNCEGLECTDGMKRWLMQEVDV